MELSTSRADIGATGQSNKRHTGDQELVGCGVITCHCTGPRLFLPLLLSALGKLAVSPGSVTPQPASVHCVGREQSIANDWVW